MSEVSSGIVVSSDGIPPKWAKENPDFEVQAPLAKTAFTQAAAETSITRDAALEV